MRKPNDINYFIKKIRKTKNCWIFTGSIDNKGYGTVCINYKVTSAHRLMWTISNGKIKNGLFVLHKCDNPPCVNPDHLFLGTQKDNMQDMHMKKRWYRNQYGEKNGNSKLTTEVIEKMKSYRKKTKLSYSKIGKKFNVSHMCAFRAITGRSWRKL